MNLLVETILAIKKAKKTIKAICFIGSEDSKYSCKWTEFEKLANIEYNKGFGAQEVAKDLIIRFYDGSVMIRQEYDGSESWRFIQRINNWCEKKMIDAIIRHPEQVGGVTMDEINTFTPEAEGEE